MSIKKFVLLDYLFLHIKIYIVIFVFILRGHDKPINVCKGDNFCDFLVSCTPSPFWRREARQFLQSYLPLMCIHFPCVQLILNNDIYLFFYSFCQDGPNIVKKMKGVFCFRVKSKDGKEGIWIVDAKNGNGSVSYGGPGKCICILSMSR